MNDNAVEAVVDEDEQVAEQLGEQVHGNPRTGPLAVEKPSSADRASGSSMARVFVSPTRFAIFSAAPPTTTAASSPSVNLSCSPPKPAMPGCSTPPISSPHGWPAMGDTEPIHIEETDTTFAIGWKGRYRIEGPAFIYTDQDTGRVSTILGYPTDKLSQIG